MPLTPEVLTEIDEFVRVGFEDRERTSEIPTEARALGAGNLFLAFDPMDANTEETEGPRTGPLVASELQRAGLGVQWNGSFNQRIGIPAFDWKRR